MKVLFLITIYSIISLAADLERLDPHGTKSTQLNLATVKSSKECLVCHTFDNTGGLLTKSNANQSCANCHNKEPHSGIAEHAQHSVSCMKCHTAHRADGKSEQAPGSFLESVKTRKFSDGMVFSSKPNAMIRKTCMECHK